jgi:hypothetical protein
VWRSLVARFVRDEEAVGSNPATPTNVFGPSEAIRFLSRLALSDYLSVFMAYARPLRAAKRPLVELRGSECGVTRDAHVAFDDRATLPDAPWLGSSGGRVVRGGAGLACHIPGCNPDEATTRTRAVAL